MSTPDRQASIITDWTAVLVDALTVGDTARAAVASATITAAAEAILDVLDPQGHVSPAVTHSNGHYVPPMKTLTPLAGHESRP